MGVQVDEQQNEPERLRAFMKHLLADMRALEQMLDTGAFETGIRRIGAEQELFLVDEAMRPAPLNLAILEDLDERFTTELGRFNLEANLDPLVFEGGCLSALERELEDVMRTVRKAATKHNADVLLCGVAPTLDLSDMSLENMTPFPRYYALNDAMMRMRGEAYEFFVKGKDELRVKHNSVMLEACNTSFQVHFQVAPDEFAELYNIAQLVTAPVLAAAVNSPLLFGKELWAETRIALFEQAVDTRRSTESLREVQPRVGFGSSWVDDSVLEILREDIARFRVILSTDKEEDALAVLRDGGVPQLNAMRLHTSTVYRWNRPCYGILNGKPHLRIENRVLPSGPTTADEVANAAFWFGLMSGVSAEYGDVRKLMDFGDARNNFLNASRHGLEAQLTWLDGSARPAYELIREELVPRARLGLERSGIDSEDVTRYMDIIEARAERRMTGAKWMTQSLKAMGEEGGRVERLRALSRAMLVRQISQQPVHEWSIAELTEAGGWRENFMTVEQFMTKDLVTAHEDEVVDFVASLMTWKKVGQVPVEDGDHRLVGLVSTADLLSLVANGLPEGSGSLVPVRDIMNASPATIPPETTSLEAIQIMKRDNVRCLLVVREDRLLGLVTEHDFMKMARVLLEAKLQE
ncbi:MAG: CBS domain-containing protein/gamma-glutamylcysteine synthetase [Bradymonadia bacterium]|jgi:CBS domain-containing protein/gamma-glutamylcysteine synthetase